MKANSSYLIPRTLPKTNSHKLSFHTISPKAHQMSCVFSFDVDGTLIQSTGVRSNWLHKQAFIHAFKEVYDLDTDIDVIAHHGGTDPLILKAVLEHHGRDGTEVMRRLKELEGSMIRFAEANAASAGEGLQTLPGVVDLLQGLKQRPNVLTCLVTGNLEPIGWLKMRHLGLYDCFTAPQFGGFGTDFCSGNSAEMWHDRAEFVRIAGQKADTIASEKGLPAIVRRVHVGDTPFDIKAAVAAGAFALGVTTGVFSRAELEACMDVGRGEGFVLDSLEDLDEVLRVTGCADL